MIISLQTEWLFLKFKAWSVAELHKLFFVLIKQIIYYFKFKELFIFNFPELLMREHVLITW